MLRLCALGSGSEGNAWVIEAHDGTCCTRVLIDNGFGPRALAQRLARAGLAAGDLDGVFVTHEHSDHASGVAALARRYRLRVFASAGTAAAAGLLGDGGIDLTEVVAGELMSLGALAIVAFDVPHDAAEPTHFRLSDGARTMALLTDIGAPDVRVARALDGVDALVLECNHDPALLAASAYPAFLKARIASAHGHLSNGQAAELLAGIDRSRLNWVVAAHLSRRNNAPPLAQAALADVLECDPAEVAVATQDDGLDWRRV